MKFSNIFRREDYTTISLHPFVHLLPSIRTASICMLVFLLPHVAMLFVTASYASLAIVAATVAGALLAEGVFRAAKCTARSAWLIALIQGIMVGLLLPSPFPPVEAFFLILVTMLLCKYAFGGFAASWVNTVAVTVALAYFLNAPAFPPYLLTNADLQNRNAALVLIQGGQVPLIPQDAAVTAFLNRTVFSSFGVEIPDGYVTLFWDSGAAIPAFRFNTITLLTSLIFFAFELADILIPAVFIGTYVLLVRFVSGFFIASDMVLYGDIFLALLTSGVLFSTLFLLQWYGTTPQTLWGKALYGFTAGVCAFLIIGCGTSPVGYVFVVLLMNLFSVMVQVIEQRQVRRRLAKVLLPQVNALQEGV